jgi:hypothetical protein
MGLFLDILPVIKMNKQGNSENRLNLTSVIDFQVIPGRISRLFIETAPIMSK